MLRRLLTFLIFFALLGGQTSGQGTWTQKANFGGNTRQGAVGFSIGGKGYIGTGSDGSGGPSSSYKDFWEYDPVLNAWTQKANFGGAARSAAVGFSIGSKGYIGTGVNGTTYYQDFWEWDQGTNVWTPKANIPGIVKYAAVGFSIGSKGYIGTGANGTTYYQDFWEWDQATDTWIQKANFGGGGRGTAIAFSIGTKGYIGLGTDSSTWPLGKNDFWEWNPSTNVWTQKANFGGFPRTEAIGFSIGNYGYIGTGTTYIGTSSISDFWAYNSSTNVWTQKANFGGGIREMAAGFSIGCKGYAGTGYVNDNWGTVSTDFWEFDPDTCAGIGIIENQNKFSLTIYPNPMSTQTTLWTTEQLKNATLTVDNCFGQTVKEIKKIKGQTLTLHRDNLPIGTYFLCLTQDGKIIATDKLVIAD